MSYDKNTTITSDMDAIVRTLDVLKQRYTLRTIDEIHCRGNNNLGKVKIRRLEYGDRVVLERMVHTADCDDDDVLESHEFSRANDPGNTWQWVIDLPEDAPWPGPIHVVAEIDALRLALRELSSAVEEAQVTADGPFMTHKLIAALDAANALLNKDRA